MGVLFSSNYKTIVLDEPLLNLEFSQVGIFFHSVFWKDDAIISQALSSVSGSVQCIGGSCGDMIVSLQAVDRAWKAAEQLSEGSLFKFNQVLPGAYKVRSMDVIQIQS